MNNIHDHIARANARMNFMELFLMMALVCAVGPTPEHNAMAAVFG